MVKNLPRGQKCGQPHDTAGPGFLLERVQRQRPRFIWASSPLCRFPAELLLITSSVIRHHETLMNGTLSYSARPDPRLEGRNGKARAGGGGKLYPPSSMMDECGVGGNELSPSSKTCLALPVPVLARSDWQTW